MSHQFEPVEALDGFRSWEHPGNGLTVITCTTPVAPVASFCVVYRVGSRHEATGHTGATHILEHLMFKGTERFNRDRGTEIARVLQRVGASFNATTWLDRTSYYETVPVEHLSLAMEIEADRMRGALVREQDLASERTVVLNELARGENDAFDLLLKASFGHAFLEHPYHHPTIGWRCDVENVTASVLRRFYDTYYHPDNATVMVVGDIDEQATLAEVERLFGAIPPAPGPVPEVLARESEQRGERRFEIHRAGEVGWLALSWHIPRGLHQDLPALSVLAQILAEGVTSRLYQKLVETNLCLSVHAFAWQLHDPGLLQVFATLAPGVEHARIEAIVRDEITTLRDVSPAASEVERAKVQVRTDLAFHRESPARMVAALTEAVAIGDWRRFVHELDEIQTVTADDVRTVAERYLTDLHLTVGWFVPEGGAGVGGSADAAPAPCYYRAPFVERVDVRELPGGGRLAVLPNPHAPTVTIAGSLLAGRALVEDGRAVVAAFTAAMAERGTRRRGRLELARELEDHGLELALEAPSGTPTLATFSAQGLAEHLPRLATLLGEVMREPTFPADELQKLREQALGQLARERQETFPRAFTALTQHLYPAQHPLYRRTIEDREREVRGLVREDLETFHERAYGPASLVVAVVGQVDPDQVSAVFADVLGGWEGGIGSTPQPAVPPPCGPAEELIHLTDRPNADMLLGHAAGLHRGSPDYPAAVLANACLGHSTLTSRLGLELRDRAGLTYGVYSRFFGVIHVPGPWAVYLSVAPENLRRAETLCRSTIERYVAEGPTEDEVAEERDAQSGSYRVGLATNGGVARELVTALTSGVEVGFLDGHPARLAELTRDEVLESLRRHINPRSLVMTAAGSLEGEPK
ncbi:MAG: insulinase family protein [Acidobacteria bacterium]|jgi:zinc protease|nr:insulinase family protein [Acidobacteriota bacterium]